MLTGTSSRPSCLACRVSWSLARAWLAGDLEDQDVLLAGQGEGIWVGSIQGKAGIAELAALVRAWRPPWGVFRMYEADALRFGIPGAVQAHFREASGQVRWLLAGTPAREFLARLAGWPARPGRRWSR